MTRLRDQRPVTSKALALVLSGAFLLLISVNVRAVLTQSDVVVQRPTTPAQIAEAHLFENYSGGQRLQDAGRVVMTVPAMPRLPEGTSTEGYLESQVCHSDAVFVGIVVAQRIFANTSETFLFTEYDIALQHSIRGIDDQSHVPHGARTVTFVAAGGKGS
jgi:hypothetical protein